MCMCTMLGADRQSQLPDCQLLDSGWSKVNRPMKIPSKEIDIG